GGVYRGDLSYLSTASKKFFDVFLTAFHNPSDFHAFDLYYRAFIAPPVRGRALNRPYCLNSFCPNLVTGNRQALPGDCGYRSPAGLSLTYVSSAGKTRLPFRDPFGSLPADWKTP